MGNRASIMQNGGDLRRMGIGNRASRMEHGEVRDGGERTQSVNNGVRSMENRK